ncbi:MAG: hypothetical protein HY706_13485 [Candidatus Hydrogenedentes bacterium]|nr:hypothetical protein [Candidatus Hydrogenedentota bacterium]
MQGADGRDAQIEGVIDTGPTGFLSLPQALIAELGLVWRGRAQAVLADGSLHLFDVYQAAG